jgi:2-oxoisovalerate dehydrogenase E1 component
VPPELIEAWDKKDPVRNYEQYLLQEGVLTEEVMTSLKKENEKLIQDHLDITEKEPELEANLERELGDVYKPFKAKETAPGRETKELRLVDAISDGLNEAMQKHPKLILMGQDIGDYGGVFKITDGFVKKFGKERVRNTPLCESGIVGTALGLSLEGFKSMVEMQFADFVTCGFNQIVNNLAKLHYR